MIKVRHLKKVFKTPGGDELAVLKDINCDIEKGEVISIIGPSGTGKSTFLRCLNRLEEPTSGVIEVDGMDILDRKTDISLVRRRMGMVFQNFNLFEHLTILDNVTLCPMTLLGKSREEAEQKGMELLGNVGLHEKAGCLPRELSGGQKQRAAIARCLAMEPDIILFDEPTSALDPTMVSEVLGVIRHLASRGMTMCIVSHEMQFVRDVSTRILFLNDGIVYEEGTPEQIFDNPQKPVTKAFINRIRTLECRFEDKRFDLYGLFGKIHTFCSKYGLGIKTLEKIQHITEEMLCGIMPFRGPVTLLMEYSEKTSRLCMTFIEDNAKKGILDGVDEDSLSLMLVRGMSASLTEPQNGVVSIEV
ncbi:MAG: amino acid ABC transporter ATP-binding protein [Bacteroidaceae bacterium]|nr:amino acid ABC transporter ATP-binding protein [Bacteroidaceae bacterium]